jgi:glycosyltransferase involved in cell wall biosynthesis
MDEHTRRCAEEIKDFGADVLYAGSSLTVAASPIGRYVDIPSVLYLQEPMRFLYEARPALLWVGRPRAMDVKEKARNLRYTVFLQAARAQARAEWENAHGFDRVLVNSYFSRETLLRTYGVDAKVCYLGVDLHRYVDRGGQRGPLVVGVGQFSPHKRLDVAVRAVACLPEPRPELAWVGNYVDKAYLAEVESLAQQLGVQFVPYAKISHEEVVDVLNRAAALVYAPLLEPFGYAPLEAAACGVPVVAKAEGGIRETVIDGQTGYLVDNDEDLGPALAQLLSDGERARQMGKAGREDVERRWSLQAAVDRLESHLADVASSGRQLGAV